MTSVINSIVDQTLGRSRVPEVAVRVAASVVGFLVRAIKWHSIGLAKWVWDYEREERKGQ